MILTEGPSVTNFATAEVEAACATSVLSFAEVLASRSDSPCHCLYMLQAKRDAFGVSVPLDVVCMTLVVLALLKLSPTPSFPAKELSRHNAKSFEISVEAAVQSFLSEPNLSVALLVMQL